VARTAGGAPGEPGKGGVEQTWLGMAVGIVMRTTATVGVRSALLHKSGVDTK